MLKKHQRRNKDGSIIDTLYPEQGDLWTSQENELYQQIRELDQKEDEETKKYCDSQTPRIKDQMRKRIYDPKDLSLKVKNKN